MAWTHHDLSRAARRRLPAPGFLGPSGDLALAAAGGALAVPALGAALGGTAAPALAGALVVYALGAGLATRAMLRRYPHEGVGLCNLVTLVRLVLTCALIAPLLSGTAAHWGLFVVAALALSLDGLDGWLARRQRLASGFGARFDMEVDSLLALVLALMAWTSGTAVAAVVLLGLPRYAFGAAGLVLPWMRRDLPDRFSRKAVCVLQLGTLIVLQLPFVPGAVAGLLVAVACGALGWSFWRDIAWLRQARA
jgi:phosphatidylglycerophosphate synthase